MANTLVEIFMHRDDLTKHEATEIVNEMKDMVRNGENPEDVLYEQGLEPDYMFDLLDED
jgi:hypothetical protein